MDPDQSVLLPMHKFRKDLTLYNPSGIEGKELLYTKRSSNFSNWVIEPVNT
jgi:hypothetical protein